jgi:hypothetical protein
MSTTRTGVVAVEVDVVLEIVDVLLPLLLLLLEEAA